MPSSDDGHRWLSLKTPLGDNALNPTEVIGTEGISKLFSFEISVLSESASLKPADLLGQSVTLGIGLTGGSTRYVNGIVTSMAAGRMMRSGYRIYRLIVSPKLWTLQQSSHYRLFYEQSVKDIATVLFGEASLSLFEFAASPPVREYCVQYGETDLAFLQRILAEEGFFFYFRHEMGKHTLVIVNQVQSYASLADEEIEYHPEDGAFDAVTALNFRTELRSYSWSTRDYDFESPDASPESTSTTNVSKTAASGWEHHQFAVPMPGGAKINASTLKGLADHRKEADEAAFEVAEGSGNYVGFTPGYKFGLKGYPDDDAEELKLVITDVRHEAKDTPHFTISPDAEGKPGYSNTFSCIPATRPARVMPAHRKPEARGAHTAVVVGPSGQDIYTDKHGRIRIQFHWDREGKSDEKSTCFVRVAQMLAGKNWGSVFIPRIGMEVVVHFLDGDPDRPIVTGAVYNGTNVPPWSLPDNANKSGLLTRSTPNGSADKANELSFCDEDGKEKILLHAQKDFVREVENDDTLDVGHDQVRTIKNDRTATIKEGNETLTIEKGNRTETLKTGNEAVTIEQGNRTHAIKTGNDTLEIDKGNRSVTLMSGDDKLSLTKGSQVITITAGDLKATCSAGKVVLTATAGVSLVCGPNKIELTPQGITIQGVQVSAKGNATAEIGAPMVTVKGDAMTQINGGIVKIN